MEQNITKKWNQNTSNNYQKPAILMVCTLNNSGCWWSHEGWQQQWELGQGRWWWWEGWRRWCDDWWQPAIAIGEWWSSLELIAEMANWLSSELANLREMGLCLKTFKVGIWTDQKAQIQYNYLFWVEKPSPHRLHSGLKWPRILQFWRQVHNLATICEISTPPPSWLAWSPHQNSRHLVSLWVYSRVWQHWLS